MIGGVYELIYQLTSCRSSAKLFMTGCGNLHVRRIVVTTTATYPATYPA